MNDRGSRRALLTGWLLLAFCLPLGLTLEALHALKVDVYLGSALRRELWTLAHAHGNLLGMLCLVFGALGERVSADAARRARLATWIAAGSVAMPLGFLLGGVGNHEGDPSYGILLVPVGAAALLWGLFGTARATFAAAEGR